jgi:hypothetical protein
MHIGYDIRACNAVQLSDCDWLAAARVRTGNTKS